MGKKSDPLTFIRSCVVLAALIVALAFAFASAPAAVAQEADEAGQSPGGSTQEYFIGPEDVLDIYVWKNEELSKKVTVRPDGRISLPLLGDIQAAGLTPEDLENIIVQRLKKYQQTSVASVIVDQVNSYKVYILGEVVNPGAYQINRRTTILQAIALAGGFNQFASKNKMVLIREHAVDGEKKLLVKFDDIVDPNARLKINHELRPGDTIFVP